MRPNHTIQEVKKFIESFNCKLLSNKYKNRDTLLSIQCQCGENMQISFGGFKQTKHKKCRKCAKKNECDKRRFSFDSVRNYIESKDCKLLSTTYENTYAKLHIQCKCGEQWQTTFKIFKKSPYGLCNVCASKKMGENKSGIKSHLYGMKGKLHHNYNKNPFKKKFTKLYTSPEYRAVREKVLLRDNCTCKKCGFIAKFKGEKRSLNMHHLFSKTNYQKWVFRLLNLITLCAECHINFHKQFGYSNNTPKQMKIYLKGII